MHRFSNSTLPLEEKVTRAHRGVTYVALAACLAIVSCSLNISAATAQYSATQDRKIAHSDVPDLSQLDNYGAPLTHEDTGIALEQNVTGDLLAENVQSMRSALSLSYQCTFIAGYDAGPGIQEDIEIQGELPLTRCGMTSQGPLYRLSTSCDEDVAPQHTVHRFADGRQLVFFLYGIALNDRHFNALSFMSIVQNMPQYDFVHLERALWEIVPPGITRHQVNASGPVPMCYFSITKR